MRLFIVFFLVFSQLFAVIELNTATSDELLKLNGIGKAKSQKIINYRETNQCFKNIDELADVEGVSKKIVESNRANLTLGPCQKTINAETSTSSLLDVLFDPINVVFVLLIALLGFLDQKTGKDLKSQIISVGVLGTFVGIFIGLQSFNPADITNSVNDILVGLKTAFFTSIVGMSVATTLSVIQKLREDSEVE